MCVCVQGQFGRLIPCQGCVKLKFVEGTISTSLSADFLCIHMIFVILLHIVGVFP